VCGIAGLWSAAGPAATLEDLACAMRDRLRRRGPDDAGVWADSACGIALGHRRLSIIDLSPSGRQPMASADGRWVVAYNGEIYNYRDVAAELGALGVRFRGSSDTEVLVEAIARFGVDAALRRMAGMFAFAAWDRGERRLFLARDRLGIKPLYYGWWRGALLFGSELKALDAVPGFAPDVDRDALASYLRHRYIPAPHTVWKQVRKLPPGHLVECAAPGREVESRAWWSAREAAGAAKADPFGGTPSDAVDELERLLGRVVREHMISDVPLGAFLSGGIDSSTVVSLMQAHGSRPVETFTIGFDEDAFDEAAHARAVAQHLGTAHTELYLRSKDAEAVIPSLPDLWDEPFADVSQIPTYLVARLARRSVTVALSGDGGDELFGGYSRYPSTLATWQGLAPIPYWLRRLGAAALRGAPGAEALVRLAWRARGTQRPYPASAVLEARAELLSHPSLDALYRHSVSTWTDPGAVVLGAREPGTAFTDPRLTAEVPDALERMMLVDSVTYLPDNILTKVDRASMAVSLEARVPLLDHRVFEFAWRLPAALKLREGVTKWPLRELLARRVPRRLFERPKQGFGVPIADWIRGPLREWCEELLAEPRLRRDGFFDAARVRKVWTDYLAGWPTLEQEVWTVLMFQAWWEHRRAAAGAAA